MPTTHRLTFGIPLELSQTSTRGRDYCEDRTSVENEFLELREQFIGLQAQLYAEGQ